jgi:3-deoxy-D-manno-octulosonic-acid transferase
MLARLLRAEQVHTLEEIATHACRAICISAVPPHAASHAAYLARRLRKRFPELKIVVALWTSEGIDKVKPRLLGVGVDEVATRLPEVLAHLRP